MMQKWRSARAGQTEVSGKWEGRSKQILETNAIPYNLFSQCVDSYVPLTQPSMPLSNRVIDFKILNRAQRFRSLVCGLVFVMLMNLFQSLHVLCLPLVLFLFLFPRSLLLICNDWSRSDVWVIKGVTANHSASET